MADKRDYYEALGINKGANEDEIKRAFRSQAKKYHPDVNPNDKTNEVKFKEINEAYNVLSDAEKKAAYDQYGHAAFEQGAGFGGGGFQGGFDMGDIFEQFFGGGGGGGGGGFSDIFGSGSRRQGPQKGANVQTTIQIKFEEAIFGCERELKLNLDDTCDTCDGSGAKPGTHPETCKACNGSGQQRVQQQTMFGTTTTVRTCQNCGGEGKIAKDPCPTCGGKGRERKQKTIQVTIPKGIDDGQSIRIGGKGEAGSKGGQHGDLLINIRVQAHHKFKRDGMNLFIDVPLSFVQAALGDEISIPLMDGEEKYQVKAGTQTHTNVTLRGKGAPNVRNNKVYGDLIATLLVQVPTNLNERQKDLLREFAKTSGEDVKEKKNGFFKNKK